MNLSTFSDLIQNALGAHLPGILGAISILVIGYVLALLARAAVRKLLSLASINSFVGKSIGKPIDLEGGIALAVFWFVLLATLLAVFNTLDLDQLSGPLAGMIAEIMAYLPHLLAGAVLLLVAWLAASLVKAIANRALKATQWDEKLVEHAGMTHPGENIGNVLFWLVILLFLPAILGVLRLEGILDPVRNMVDQSIAMLPNIFAAVLILFVTWYVARTAGVLLGNLLANIGLNHLPAKMGLGHIFSDSFKASDLVTRIVVFFAMLFATVEAANRLDFNQVETLVSMFIQFGGDVLLGVGILLVGFWLANLAHQVILRASNESVGMAGIARFAILGLVLALGLSAMGIADDIVNMAFAFVFGAVAVAVALSFGLGGAAKPPAN